MTIAVAEFKRLDSPGPGPHGVVNGARRQAGERRIALRLPQLEQHVVLRRGERVAVLDVVVRGTEIERVVLRSHALEALLNAVRQLWHTNHKASDLLWYSRAYAGGSGTISCLF